MKIKGFNPKEQRLFDILKDGKQHKIGEMKRAMTKDAKAHCAEIYEKGSWDDSHVNAQAQSYVRNSIRRLIRDGWVRKVDYGTYQLTSHGKRWVAEGKDETKSFGTKRGRKPGTKLTKDGKVAKAPAKKTKAKTSSKKTTKTKKTTKKAAAKAKPKKAVAKKTNGKSTKKVAQKAAQKAKNKSAMLKKAQAAKKRVGKMVALEKAKAAQASAAASA